MAEGIVIRKAHFPGRAPVDAYGNGGFRFADMSHRGSILCLPSGIHGWEPTDAAKLGLEDFERVLQQAPAPMQGFIARGLARHPLRME